MHTNIRTALNAHILLVFHSIFYIVYVTPVCRRRAKRNCGRVAKMRIAGVLFPDVLAKAVAVNIGAIWAPVHNIVSAPNESFGKSAAQAP